LTQPKEVIYSTYYNQTVILKDRIPKAARKANEVTCREISIKHIVDFIAETFGSKKVAYVLFRILKKKKKKTPFKNSMP
jgi:hypothetical protein